MRKTRDKSSVLPGNGPLRCHCGSMAVLRDASMVCRTPLKGAMAYVCANYPKCDSYVMASPTTHAPLGSLAGPELRRLRREAHLQFNQLYQSGLMTKREAYRWLAYMVQAPMAHAHIGHLGDYYCKVVIQESNKLLSSQLKSAKAVGGESYVAAY